jgi:hypothetical protein
MRINMKMIDKITAGDHLQGKTVIKSKGLQGGKKTIEIIGIDMVGMIIWELSILLTRTLLLAEEFATENHFAFHLFKTKFINNN